MADIKLEARWSTYRLVRRDDGSFDKMPTRPTNRPELWLEFQAARCEARQRRLGLALLLGAGRVGIDIDACALDPALTREIVAACGAAYVECSPSGAGLHVLGRAPEPWRGAEADMRTGKRVRWEGPRFFAVTLNGRGNPETDISAVLDTLAPATRRAPQGAKREGYAGAAECSDDELLLQAAGAENGLRFLRLWRGDTSGYGSHSEADMALCRMLAFWTNGDAGRVDRLFRLSNLYRPKWERRDYREATLAHAVQG